MWRWKNYVNDAVTRTDSADEAGTRSAARSQEEIRLSDQMLSALRRMQSLYQDGCVVTSAELVDSWLPKRPPDAHKGDFGRVLILAGSVGYTGAPALAAKAALRSGAGLIFVGVPEAVYPIVAQKLDEPMVFPLACDEEGRLNTRAMP